jgi:hypothetical protein
LAYDELMQRDKGGLATTLLPDRTVPVPEGVGRWFSQIEQADAGIRTPDPFITSEVLYQLSYVGADVPR